MTWFLFLSPVFAGAFATVSDSVVELYNTDGSQGAARGAGVGAGIYSSCREAFTGLKKTRIVEPDKSLKQSYADAYGRWLEVLRRKLGVVDKGIS